MPGLTELQKKQYLSKMSYKDFLLKIVKVHPEVVTFYQTNTWGLYGVGIDAVIRSRSLGRRIPRISGTGFATDERTGIYPARLHGSGRRGQEEKPYNFHFPDGNASVARLLTRSLIPASAPGNTAEDIVTAKFDYSRLDEDGAPVRIRLNSPVVRVRHLGDPANAKEVEVLYAQGEKVYAVRAKSRFSPVTTR